MSSYTCHTYVPGEGQSEELLDSYLSETTVENNRTRKNLRVDLYDGKNGVLFLLLEDRRVVGMTSCVRHDEAGVASAKVWHRLHILPHVPHSMIDRYFEPKTFEWCRAGNIERLWVTFNDSTPRIAGWAAARMGERRNAARPNPYANSFGEEIRRGWRPHHKMIYERGVWQYVIYYSPNGKPFLKRVEKELDDEMVQIFKREFPNATRRWN